MITVKLFANFREAAGKNQEKVESVEDVASLIDELVVRFGRKLANELYLPETREMRDAVNILVNGRGIKIPQDLKAPLKDGDVVVFFPPVSGG